MTKTKKTTATKKAKKTAAKKTKAGNAKNTDSLHNALADIKTKFGEESIMRMGEQPGEKIEAIPTGSLGLDAAIGIGGVPRGRVIEIFGPESSGKTTLALHNIAEAQKQNGICAFVDAEHALDPSYAKKIGVQLDDLLVSQPDTGEQALDIVDSLVRTNTVDVIVVDSVAALTPRAEIEGDMGDQHVGRQARLMSQALRKLTAITARSSAVVIFINQIRMKIGVMFGSPETTSGGKALKFYSSLRLDVRRIQQIKKGDEVMGGRVRVKVVKNKVGAPYRTAEFDLMYNEGITREGELLALGEKYDLVEKRAASYSYGDHKLGRGYDAARTFLRENKEVNRDLEKKVRAMLDGLSTKDENYL